MMGRLRELGPWILPVSVVALVLLGLLLAGVINVAVTGALAGFAGPWIWVWGVVMWPVSALGWLYRLSPIGVFLVLFALTAAVFFFWFARLSRTISPERQFDVLREHWLFEDGDPERPFRVVGSLWNRPFLRLFVSAGGGDGARVVPALCQWNSKTRSFEELVFDRHLERMNIAGISRVGPWTFEAFRNAVLSGLFPAISEDIAPEPEMLEETIAEAYAQLSTSQATIDEDPTAGRKVREMYLALIFDRKYQIKIHYFVALYPSFAFAEESFDRLVRDNEDFTGDAGYWFGSALTRPAGTPESYPDWASWSTEAPELRLDQLEPLGFPRRRLRIAGDGSVRYDSSDIAAYVSENRVRFAAAALVGLVFSSVALGTASLTPPDDLATGDPLDQIAAVVEGSDASSEDQAGDPSASPSPTEEGEAPRVRVIQTERITANGELREGATGETGDDVAAADTTPEMETPVEEPPAAPALIIDPNAAWTYGEHPLLGLSAHVDLGEEVIGLVCGNQDAAARGETVTLRFTPGLAQSVTAPEGYQGIISFRFDGLPTASSRLLTELTGPYMDINDSACGTNVEAFIRGRALILVDNNDPAGTDASNRAARETLPLSGSGAAIRALIGACPALAADIETNPCGN